MEKLEINNLENISGGWSLERCIIGASTTVMALGLAGVVGGPWGYAALAGVGCVLQGMD